MSSRQVFYAHAVVVTCLVLSSKVPIDPDFSVPPLFLASVVLPFVIVIWAIVEKRSIDSIAAIATLSGALTVASFYAILPYCW